MTNFKETLIQKFNDKSAVVAVMGLGYVGLPLAVVFAEAGYKVVGYDLIQGKVDIINSGKAISLMCLTRK